MAAAMVGVIAVAEVITTDGAEVEVTITGGGTIAAGDVLIDDRLHVLDFLRAQKPQTRQAYWELAGS